VLAELLEDGRGLGGLAQRALPILLAEALLRLRQEPEAISLALRALVVVGRPLMAFLQAVGQAGERSPA